MFGDPEWDPRRHDAQVRRWRAFLERVDLPATVVVECGAGTAVPTIRRLGDRLHRAGATLVRVNPREPASPSGAVSLAEPALPALRAVEGALHAR